MFSVIGIIRGVVWWGACACGWGTLPSRIAPAIRRRDHIQNPDSFAPWTRPCTRAACEAVSPTLVLQSCSGRCGTHAAAHATCMVCYARYRVVRYGAVV